LFDEPLSNLDAKLRVHMRTEIKKIHQKVRTTTVYVTHDQVEAMTLADRVVVMNGGEIEQVGTPHELYHSPQTRFVAAFIGSPAMNMVSCGLEQTGNGLKLNLGKFSLPIPAEKAGRYKNHIGKGGLLCGLRPEHIFEQRRHLEPGQEPFEAVPEVVEPMGNENLIYFPLDGTEICARVDPGADAAPGRPVKLVADLRHLHLIDDASGRVL
jgi:multiple sugar transport system ATP-binding protein